MPGRGRRNRGAAEIDVGQRIERRDPAQARLARRGMERHVSRRFAGRAGAKPGGQPVVKVRSSQRSARYRVDSFPDRAVTDGVGIDGGCIEVAEAGALQEPIQSAPVSTDDNCHVATIEPLDRCRDECGPLSMLQCTEPAQDGRVGPDVAEVGGCVRVAPTSRSARGRANDLGSKPGRGPLGVAQLVDSAAARGKRIGGTARRLGTIAEREQQRESMEAPPVQVVKRGADGVEAAAVWREHAARGASASVGAVRIGAEVYRSACNHRARSPA